MAAGSVYAPIIIPLRDPFSGKSKYLVDTKTKIDITSETPETDIFYTLNNTKPQTFATKDKSTMKFRTPIYLPPGKQTIKAIAVTRDSMRESSVVTKTFEVEFIPEIIKESELMEDDTAFVDEISKSKNDPRKNYSMKGLRGNVSTASSRFMQRLIENENSPRQAWTQNSTGYRKRPKSASQAAQALENSINLVNGYSFPRDLPPDMDRQNLKLQRKIDTTRCSNCFAPRPINSKARFCTDCGKEIPPAETISSHSVSNFYGNTLGVCPSCKSTVPNTSKCLVCEADLANIGAMGRTEKVLCIVCGTINPPGMSSCLGCESRFPEFGKAVFESPAPAPDLTATGILRTCVKCGRTNSLDSRFCDWCGAKVDFSAVPMNFMPLPETATLKCKKCGSENGPYAIYCTVCGLHIAAPHRVDLSAAARTKQNGLDLLNDTAPWLAGLSLSDTKIPGMPETARTRSVMNRPIKVTTGTQTVGLYYPSEAEIRKKTKALETKMTQEMEIHDRKPLLTAVSPGRGYWRKQMDHICAHLKAHASNDPEFRSLISDARMGKILEASVRENPFALSLRVNFAVRSGNALRGAQSVISRNSDARSVASAKQFLSSYEANKKGDPGERYREHYREEVRKEEEDLKQMNMEYMNDEDIMEDDEGSSIYISDSETVRTESSLTRPIPSARKRKRKRKPKRITNEDKLSVSFAYVADHQKNDRSLVQLLGRNGNGDLLKLQELLDKGADFRGIDNDGYNSLLLAVRNKRPKAIPLLISAGADPNTKGPNKGNTALHEAIRIGELDIIQALLANGASVKKRNDDNESPQEMAIRLGNQNVINTLMTSMAQSTLNKHSGNSTRARSNSAASIDRKIERDKDNSSQEGRPRSSSRSSSRNRRKSSRDIGDDDEEVDDDVEDYASTAEEEASYDSKAY